jgi:hypothetical protein
MSKSKLSNYKYQGALASLSSSVKKVLDIDGRFIDASKIVPADEVASDQNRAARHGMFIVSRRFDLHSGLEAESYF